MGKFFEALKKSERPKRQPPPPPASEKVIKISADTVETLKLDTTPPEAPAEKLHHSSVGLDPRLISLSEPNSAAGECFKILRAKLLVSAPNKSLKAIMVSSPEPLDGKTLVAANLGVAIASGMNEHVLLVDCDLRRPSLHQRFGIKVPHGLREYLEGGTSLAPCLVDTPAKKLRLLPGGKAPPNPSELLSSEKMRRLVKELKGRYEDRYIIFDAPPAQFTAETAFLASMMDGVLLVVRSSKTSAPLISQAIENIGREKILGVVFNASRESEKNYYRYHYRYYREGHR